MRCTETVLLPDLDADSQGESCFGEERGGGVGEGRCVVQLCSPTARGRLGLQGGGHEDSAGTAQTFVAAP